MKKFLALLLAVLMIASMSATAFAEEIDDTVEGGKEGTVKVQVTDEDGNLFDADATYNVKIAWLNLTFDLVVADPDKNVEWNGSEYEITGGAWDTNTHSVTVTNYSDADVQIGAKFSNNTKTSAEKYGIAAMLSNGDKKLASAVNATTPDSTVYTISLTAAPTTLPELTFDVDVITITVQTVA